MKNKHADIIRTNSGPNSTGIAEGQSVTVFCEKFNEARLMQAHDGNRPNYWWFFIPFSTAALLGCAGIVATELFMPDNAGGMAGRLAMYRYLGSMTVCWFVIAIWSWFKLPHK